MTDESARKQFGIVGLINAMFICALLSALAAPLLRRLSMAERFLMVCGVFVVLVVGVGMFAILLRMRFQLEQRTGALELRCQRPYAAWRNFGWTLGLSIVLAGYGYLMVRGAAERAQPLFLLNPTFILMIYCLTFQVVVRWWWGFDPTIIEVRQNALVLHGLRSITWDRIRRHSWGGSVPSQLNLFLEAPLGGGNVMHFKVEPKQVGVLDAALRTHLDETQSTAADEANGVGGSELAT